MSEVLDVMVKTICHEAAGVNSYDLRPREGGELPPFSAGAHVDLHLGNGLVRSYSLLNDPLERHRYVIGVNLDRAGRGGSRYIHSQLSAGGALRIGSPRNNFHLVEGAPHTILVAGGIGITPLLSMIRRLESLGAGWTLHYAVRSRSSGAFLDTLAQWERAAPGRVNLAIDDENGGRLLDISAIAGRAPPGSHLYCCGPAPMLAAFEAATGGIEPERVHIERFSPVAAPLVDGGFDVVLAASGRRIAIPPGRTILDALLEAGVDVHHSCQQGVCGACETRVLSGLPVHRDSILSAEERAENQTMMICCSGCLSGPLVLDL